MNNLFDTIEEAEAYLKIRQTESLSNIKYITINHIAGGKDEDTTKLAFALKSAENTAIL